MRMKLLVGLVILFTLVGMSTAQATKDAEGPDIQHVHGIGLGVPSLSLEVKITDQHKIAEYSVSLLLIYYLAGGGDRREVVSVDWYHPEKPPYLKEVAKDYEVNWTWETAPNQIYVGIQAFDRFGNVTTTSWLAGGYNM